MYAMLHGTESITIFDDLQHFNTFFVALIFLDDRRRKFSSKIFIRFPQNFNGNWVLNEDNYMEVQINAFSGDWPSFKKRINGILKFNMGGQWELDQNVEYLDKA